MYIVHPFLHPLSDVASSSSRRLNCSSSRHKSDAAISRSTWSGRDRHCDVPKMSSPPTPVSQSVALLLFSFRSTSVTPSASASGAACSRCRCGKKDVRRVATRDRRILFCPPNERTNENRAEVSSLNFFFPVSPFSVVLFPRKCPMQIM